MHASSKNEATNMDFKKLSWMPAAMDNYLGVVARQCLTLNELAASVWSYKLQVLLA